jgi:hypothetical protein
VDAVVSYFKAWEFFLVRPAWWNRSFGLVELWKHKAAMYDTTVIIPSSPLLGNVLSFIP